MSRLPISHWYFFCPRSTDTGILDAVLFLLQSPPMSDSYVGQFLSYPFFSVSLCHIFVIVRLIYQSSFQTRIIPKSYWILKCRKSLSIVYNSCGFWQVHTTMPQKAASTPKNSFVTPSEATSFSTSSEYQFLFLCIFISTWYYQFFLSHSNRYVVINYYGFNLHYSTNNGVSS